MKIDLDLKDTELGWFKRFDKFYLKFVPNWFNWLGWLLILGAFQYILELSKSRIICVIYYWTILLLFRYFYAVFDGIEFVGTVFNNYRKTQIVFEIIFTSITTFAFWYISIHLAQIVKATTK